MPTEDESCNSSGKEVGYHYINTSFTGTQSPQLSGNEEFPFMCSDSGTAAPLEDKEIG